MEHSHHTAPSLFLMYSTCHSPSSSHMPANRRVSKRDGSFALHAHLPYCLGGDITGSRTHEPSFSALEYSTTLPEVEPKLCKVTHSPHLFSRLSHANSSLQVVSATRLIAEAIPTIEGLQLVGRADACVVAFATTKTSGINIYAIADCLMER